MKNIFLSLFNFYSTDIGEKARISGTIGGLVTGKYLAMVNVTDLLSAATITILTTTISFFLPYLYKWIIKKTQLTKSNFKARNVSKHTRSTTIAVLIICGIVALILSGYATFEQASPLFVLVIPFLLYGNKTGTPAE